jgi:hypothetical protein
LGTWGIFNTPEGPGLLRCAKYPNGRRSPPTLGRRSAEDAAAPSVRGIALAGFGDEHCCTCFLTGLPSPSKSSSSRGRCSLLWLWTCHRQRKGGGASLSRGRRRFRFRRRRGACFGAENTGPDLVKTGDWWTWGILKRIRQEGDDEWEEKDSEY